MEHQNQRRENFQDFQREGKSWKHNFRVSPTSQIQTFSDTPTVWRSPMEWITLNNCTTPVQFPAYFPQDLRECMHNFTVFHESRQIACCRSCMFQNVVGFKLTRNSLEMGNLFQTDIFLLCTTVWKPKRRKGKARLYHNRQYNLLVTMNLWVSYLR